MIIAIASGKGGTGKTTVAVNLALTLEGIVPVQVLDCDVEEPNAHLFLHPTLDALEKVTLPVPAVDESKCNACGRCSEVCAFHAIVPLGRQVLVLPELCHGCGGCSRFCPSGAITEEPREIGVVESGRAGSSEIGFVRGKVNVGSPIVPPVVRAVKDKMSPFLAGRDGVVIIDAPPGTSCAVVESVKGSDFCVLVTEPTPFGLNDLALAVDMARKLGVPFGVVINRSGLGMGDVIAYCRREQVPVMIEIPFDRRYAACYARGGTLVEEFPEVRQAFEGLWRMVRSLTLR